MFAKAYALASQYTQPLIVSTLLFDKTVNCSMGSFVIINSEGWIATAAHMLQVIPASQQSASEIGAYQQQISGIQQDNKLNDRQKRKAIAKLKVNPKWIKIYSLWWARDGFNIEDIRVLPEADLAIGRLVPFDPNFISEYPTIKDPSSILPGTSLCRLGFPFHDVRSTFNETTGGFTLGDGVLPVPRFPIEGIYTRDLTVKTSVNRSYNVEFLETSSPGLRGQSGGAIFDVNGFLWSIQSSTAHFDLGFNQKIQLNGKDIDEHQFIHVGFGVHPETLVGFLRENGVNINLSSA